MTISAEKKDDIVKAIEKNMEIITADFTGSDDSKYISLVNETIRMAEDAEQWESVGLCYRQLMTHYLYQNNNDMALNELNKLRALYEEKGECSLHLYISWQNLITNYFNVHDVLHAVSEFNEMLKYAQQKEDPYGIAQAYTAMAIASSHSYEATLENAKQAIKSIRECENNEMEFYIHYILGQSAASDGQYEKAIQHADDMLKLKKKAKNVELYAKQLKLYAYILLENEEEATKLFNEIQKNWDDNPSNPYFFSDLMCEYNCRYGNPEDVKKYIDYIASEETKAAMWVRYYDAKKDYANAFKWQETADSIEKANYDELSKSEVLSAQVYYKTLQLREKNQQLQIDNANSHSTLMTVVSLALLAFFIGAIVFIYISHRHNEQLKKERNKAEKLSEMKTAFIQNMSHEVRTPLNSIIGFNDLLNSPEFDFSEDERNEMLGYIHSQTDALVSLLNNVIFLSRMDGQDINTHFDFVSVNEICGTAIDLVRPKLSPSVNIIADTVLDTDLTIKSDRKLLSVAITCVLDNAAKFTKDGEIKVELLEHFYNSTSSIPDVEANLCETIRIAISNTGETIPTKNAELIFERFEKLGRYDAGFGLGLSIARESLSLVGGSIRLDTNFKEGTRFIITLHSQQD